MKQSRSVAGYLQENGTINLRRMEAYLSVLAKNDIDNFSDQYADIKWLESKKGGKAFNEEAASAAKMKKVGMTTAHYSLV